MVVKPISSAKSISNLDILKSFKINAKKTQIGFTKKIKQQSDVYTAYEMKEL
jgi:hypothetical protein